VLITQGLTIEWQAHGIDAILTDLLEAEDWFVIHGRILAFS